MKKIFSLLLLGAIIFSACKDEKAYKISGKTEFENLNGKTVLIKRYEQENNKAVTIDSAVIKNKTFSLNGKVDSASLVQIFIDSVRPEMMYLEPGTFVVNVDSLGITVTGSKANDAYAALQKFRRTNTFPAFEKLSAMYKKAFEMKDSLTMKNVTEKFSELGNKELDRTVKFLEDNMSNAFGTTIFSDIFRSISPEKVEALFNKAPEKFKNSTIGKTISEKITAEKNTAVGKDFTDLPMENPEGAKVSLSDYVGKGKYVLLDFWASWCGPCVEEMPNVAKAYKEFGPKGFEVVGISLDNNKDAWTKAIKDLHMTWPQMSDLKAQESEAVKKYGISAIPSTILLDKDGKIIAKNLKGEKLIEKLTELLK